LLLFQRNAPIIDDRSRLVARRISTRLVDRLVTRCIATHLVIVAAPVIVHVFSTDLSTDALHPSSCRHFDGIDRKNIMSQQKEIVDAVLLLRDDRHVSDVWHSVDTIAKLLDISTMALNKALSKKSAQFLQINLQNNNIGIVRFKKQIQNNNPQITIATMDKKMMRSLSITNATSIAMTAACGPHSSFVSA
jgi:hypothetical protein